MSLSVFIRLGVSVKLNFKYNTIRTIKQLFSREGVFIHGVGPTVIDYDERNDCFDVGMLDLLIDSKNEDEFNKKLVNIAELRMDNYVVCLRRKNEYVTPDDAAYKRHIMDDDDTAEYKSFDLNDITFDFFDHTSSFNADFENESKTSYDTIGSVQSFINSINNSVSYFKTFGIDEDQLYISNYNVSNT